MWIQVDPTHAGETSWVSPDEVERVDVNANPKPPWALVTLRSGATCTVSSAQAMKVIEKLIGTDLPKAMFADDPL